MMDNEPRPPVHVMSPELSLKLAQLRIFLSLIDRAYYNKLFGGEE